MAVAGHSGKISCIDTNSFTVSKTCTADYNVFDIEWGDGDWCCYTAGGDYGDSEYCIRKYTGNDYTFINKYSYDGIFPVTVNGTTVQCPAHAQYIFTDRQETEAIVIKNAVYDNIPFAWSIEHVQLN